MILATHHRITLRTTNALLEEGQKDRDDDCALEAFSEADEEDWEVSADVNRLISLPMIYPELQRH